MCVGLTMDSDELCARNVLHVRPDIVALGEEPPKRPLVAEVKEDVCAASCPIPQQCALGRGNSPLGRKRITRFAVGPGFREVSYVSFAPHSIHHPNQTMVKGLARSALIRPDVRVLELNHPPIVGLHICDVAFTVLGMVDDFLPVGGKLVLPGTVPLRFILPPRIAKATPFVSPVPNPVFPALCNHRMVASPTLA